MEQKLAESWKEIKTNRWLNIKNKTLPEIYTQQNLDVLLKTSRAED